MKTTFPEKILVVMYTLQSQTFLKSKVKIILVSLAEKNCFSFEKIHTSKTEEMFSSLLRNHYAYRFSACI